MRTGPSPPGPTAGAGPRAFDAEADRRLREAVRDDDDATLRELATAAGVSCSPLGRAPGPEAVGDHSQKKSRRAAEQERPELKAERAAWREEFAGVDPSRLVFVDETGASTAMDRTHGRSPSGLRVDGPVPHGHWKVVTLTAAVRLGGVGACLAFDGATDTAAFETYVGECLAPTLRPGDVVVLDNLSCHKTAEAARLIAAAGRAAVLAAVQPRPQPDRADVLEAEDAAANGEGPDVRWTDGAMGDALGRFNRRYPGLVLPWRVRGWRSSVTPDKKLL